MHTHPRGPDYCGLIAIASYVAQLTRLLGYYWLSSKLLHIHASHMWLLASAAEYRVTTLQQQMQT